MKTLKYYRKLNNLTQAQMATLLNVRQSVYSRKEAGTISITLEEAKKIADLFELSIEEVFFADLKGFENVV